MWVDRLIWTENQWIDYVSNKNVKTYVLKFKDDLALSMINHYKSHITDSNNIDFKLTAQKYEDTRRKGFD